MGGLCKTEYKYVGRAFVFDKSVYTVVSEPFYSTYECEKIVVCLWDDGTMDTLPSYLVGNYQDREL